MLGLILLILSILGLFISVYAFYIEKKLENNKKYSPICDINDRISCKINLTSDYSKFFLVSNSFIGIFFYIMIILLIILNLNLLILIASIPSTIFSIYLAYVSFFKLRNFCLVCTPIYIINFLITLISYNSL